MLFDVLIDNVDRWSGNNLVTSPDDQTFYIMDNTMAFSSARYGGEVNLGILHRVQVFPRGLVARIRALTEEQLARALADGAGKTRLGPLLQPHEIARGDVPPRQSPQVHRSADRRARRGRGAGVP